MKAWGSKKIIRREDLPPLQSWHVDQFSGASVQRPNFIVPEPVRAEDPSAEAAGIADEAGDAVVEAAPDEAALAAQAAAHAEQERGRLQDEARETGYQSGYEDGQQAGQVAGEAAGRESGYAAGFEAGQLQGRQSADAEVARFQQLCAGLAEAVAAYEEQLSKPILDIAVAVARQVLRSSLAVAPERILAVIREAIASSSELQGPLRLELHPDDMSLVRTLVADDAAAMHWRFEAQPDMERGGCRISTASVELDLTLPTRWRRVVHALGSNEPWAAEDDDPDA
ncbi:flagellar assembly protein FliH [Chitinimonas arctica]|uniref:Flagellar assembly protein FliH n=1 Tax=Chitinimonas arctica TaxID=2594795 RepID=A0A516SKH9_9NEIS|nr:flagellar assembly protein FliH [Chitinimonas arctica]QDQ28666.1 flagellar assembly protein FliH [Chitinimonas arctica]